MNTPDSRRRGYRLYRKKYTSEKPSYRNRMINWADRNRLAAFGVLALLIGLILLINPFARLPFLFVLLPRQWAVWLAYEGGSRAIGGVLLVMATVPIIEGYRQKALRNKAWWSDHCPNCGHHRLRRIHRTMDDRLINAFINPVRRFVCPKCHWRGRRIDVSRV
jgi:hypothetical protein